MRNNNLLFINQFFPPDFAATGQLLDDLTKRLAVKGYRINVFTGVPSYAFNYSKVSKDLSYEERHIYRSRTSAFLPLKKGGRIFNSFFFAYIFYFIF